MTGVLGVVAAAGLAAAVALSTGALPSGALPTGAPADPAAAAVAAGVGAAAAPDPAALLRSCSATVAAGRAAVAAARPAHRNWAEHVRAQLDLDAGLATLERTRERWAASKATADADLAGFATAHAAFEAVRDGCEPAGPAAALVATAPVETAPVEAVPVEAVPVEAAARPVAAPVPADAAAVLARCRAELDPVVDAVAAAKAVVDDWGAHVADDADREHIDPARYGSTWHGTVKAAPADLDRFARASLALDGTTGCPASA